MDYWGYFRYCVKELSIPPSEAWHIDLVEIDCLSNSKKSEIDLTVMLNYERERNGASKEWLLKN